MTQPIATPTPLRFWPWIILSAVALFIAIKAIPFVTTHTAFYDPIFRDKYARHLAFIFTHGACSILALALGPFQFMRPAGRRARLWHRRLGYVYLSCVAVGAVTGFRMGLIAFGGASSQIAFMLIAIGWLATGWLALDFARRRDFQRHRAWMIRNYALTFGAAMLRINLNLFQWAGLDFVTIYPYMAWISWFPNIAVAECLIRVSASRRAQAHREAQARHETLKETASISGRLRAGRSLT